MSGSGIRPFRSTTFRSTDSSRTQGALGSGFTAIGGAETALEFCP